MPGAFTDRAFARVIGRQSQPRIVLADTGEQVLQVAHPAVQFSMASKVFFTASRRAVPASVASGPARLSATRQGL